MQDFIDLLRPKAEEFAAQYNLRIYDITLRRERAGRVLRIYLDGDVSLENCAAISRLVSAWLDKQDENFIPYEHYQLEVSSPGIDRPLRNAEDFISQKGKVCRIQTKEKDNMGRKRYKGRITDILGDNITIYAEEESVSFTIPINGIAKANVEIEI